MESQDYVDGDIVDSVLHGSLAEGGEHVRHLAAVFSGDLVGLELELTTGFEVDEEMGPRVVVEVDLMDEVIGMEDDDLMLVVA